MAKTGTLKSGVIRACALTALAVVLDVPAHAAENYEQVSASNKALVQSTCTDIVLLSKGSTQFDACVESLARTLVSRTKGQSLSIAMTACSKSNLYEGSAAFATCVLDQRNRAESARPQSGEVESVVVTEGKISYPSQLKSISFSNSDPTERRHKQEYACAQLGLTPGLGGFAQCVTDLSVSIDSAGSSF